MVAVSKTIEACWSPVEKVFFWAQRKPDSVFLRHPQTDGSIRDYTWSAAAAQVAAVAASFRELGLSKGDRVAILAANSPHWLMADLAIQLAGCISLPVYTSMSADGVSHVVDSCKPGALILGAAPNWSGVEGCFGTDCPVVSIPGCSHDDARYQWEELRQRNDGNEPDVFPDLDDHYTILQTSGSTGTPKGVVQTFRCPVVSGYDFATTYRTGESARFVSYLPLAHAGERTLILGCCIHGGGTLYFAGPPEGFLSDLQNARPTFFLGVPRIWEKLRQAALARFADRIDADADSSVRGEIQAFLGFDELDTGATGGAPMPPELNRWYRDLGLDILEIYASSEIASAIVSTHEHHREGSVGRALPDVDVKIADDGEIVIRSASQMLEYYGEPEKTRQTTIDGWVHTGDMGRLDSEGYLYITGRLKDIYKTTKGKYVAPLPVERNFAGNKLLEQVCLVGEGLAQPVLVAQKSAVVESLSREEVEKQLSEMLASVNAKLQKHERIEFIILSDVEWNEANGLCTHSMKIKRANVEDKYKGVIGELYPSMQGSDSVVYWQ